MIYLVDNIFIYLYILFMALFPFPLYSPVSVETHTNYAVNNEPINPIKHLRTCRIFSVSTPLGSSW